jgi:hypothetical protein
MLSTKTMTLRLLSLAALLAGGLTLAACGGGGTLPGGSTLLVDGPVMNPPPPGTNLPDPIPMPDGDGTPIDPVPPEQPPAEPPVPEEPPHEDPPAPVPAPDLARVAALALVTENASVAEEASTYVGLYAGDDDGGIWRRSAAGDWKRVGELGLVGSIQAMTYVRTRHALYLALETPAGARLARWLLTPTPEVFDDSVDPPVLVDAGGEQLQLLEDSGGSARFEGAERVTGLAFDTATDTLYAWNLTWQAQLLRVPDLDVARAELEHGFSVADGLLSDAQDMAYDRTSGRLVLVDAALATVIELDHLGLAFHHRAAIAFADVRALALEEDGTRVAVDRASAALVRFDANGAVLD